MARQHYGTTWWGAQWLNALTEIDYDNRLPRGRTYANKGAVEALAVDGGTVRAKVKGRRRAPYRVTLAVPPLTAGDARRLVDRVAADPALIGRLLNRELDPAVLECAEALGIHVFPRHWRDLRMECSCPDWAVPCKHLAAVIYTLSREIDADPFRVFALRGVDLVAELDGRGVAIGAVADGDPLPFDAQFSGAADSPVTEAVAEPEAVFDPERLGAIDFSNLPGDLLEPLTRVLPERPVFAPGRDLRKEWSRWMGRAARHAAKALEAGGAAPPAGETVAPFQADDRPRLIFDAAGDVTVDGAEAVREIADLLAVLETVGPDDLPDLQPEVVGLYAARLAALHLLAAGAAVPWVFSLPKGGAGLYWVPAALDAAVAGVVDELAGGLPPGLVAFQRGRKRIPAAARTQARMACAAFLDHWVREWGAGTAAPQSGDRVGALFFGDGSARFDGPGEAGTAAAIGHWLSRLHLGERAYAPVLRLGEDDGGGFTLSIDVEPRRGAGPAVASRPVPLAEVLGDERWADARAGILQTASLFIETYPPIAGYVGAGAVEPITVPPEALPDLLFEVLPVVRMLGVRALLPKGMERLLRPRPSMEVAAAAPDAGGVLSAGDLFRFDWRVAVGDHVLTPGEFEELVAGATGVVRFRGEYVYLDPAEIERLRGHLDRPPKVSGAEATRIALAGEHRGAPVRLLESARRVIDELTAAPEVAPPNSLRAELRPYQRRGFQWLYRNVKAGLGGLIADDMGLGKTLQVIAVLLKLKEEGELDAAKALVVVPTTLLTNWSKEIERFAPALSVDVYHGPARVLERRDRPDVLLTTYGVVRSDARAVKVLPWRVAVVDEAQNIKNPAAAQAKAVRSIEAGARIAMSGTPVENRLSEYWSVMDFVNRGYLGSAKRFQEEFGVPIQVHHDRHAAERFRRVTAPFLIRRLKTDRAIITDLPEKIEQDRYCELTPSQTAVYESVVREGLRVIEGESAAFRRQGLVLQMILALKQICNHPAHYLKQGETGPAESGKAQHLLDLLDDIVDRHEKVLVFTQFREMGDLLSGWLEARYGRAPSFLHGGVGRKARDAMVERFQNDRTERIFLLSLKAGGTGLNLTAASHVIHYDLWWNPAVEAQATDRAYRIGQSRKVQVHRLITRATFEEKINEMIRSKRELAELVVGAGERWIGNLSDADLRELVALEPP